MGKTAKPSALVDTRVIYCGDNLEQLAKLPARVRRFDLHRPAVQLQPQLRKSSGARPRRKRAFEDRHASTQAYID